MFYEAINANVFGRSITFAIALVVTPRSNSLGYTISVHAVHRGAERNVCNVVVSTETPPNHNPSQTLLPVYKLADLPLPNPKSSPPRPPQPLAQPFARIRHRCKYQGCVAYSERFVVLCGTLICNGMLQYSVSYRSKTIFEQSRGKRYVN